MNNKRHIVMCGPHFDLKGGISFVVLQYLKAGLHRKVPLFYIPTYNEGSHSKKIIFFLTAVIQLVRVMVKKDVSICHLHVSQNGSFFRKMVFFEIARSFGCKVIVHIHGSRFEKFMRRNSVNRMLTRAMFNAADRVIVLSDDWKSMIEAFAHKASVIKLFNPAPRPEPEKKSVYRGLGTKRPGLPLNVLFLGRLSRRKGTYDLLECVRDDRQFYEKRNVKFIIAGDGDIREAKAFVEQNDLHELIDVPGWVFGEAKNRYLENADIYILPSYLEQMPMSILEAMAYGVPVISTWVAGIPELIEDGKNGLLIRPGDKAHLKKALHDLAGSMPKRVSMGRESLKRVAEQFDSRLIVRQLVSIYREL